METEKKKGWFRWWYIPVAYIVIIALHGISMHIYERVILTPQQAWERRQAEEAPHIEACMRYRLEREAEVEKIKTSITIDEIAGYLRLAKGDWNIVGIIVSEKYKYSNGDPIFTSEGWRRISESVVSTALNKLAKDHDEKRKLWREFEAKCRS